MKEPLGNLNKVKIRDRWPNEASDFTPWLAEEENMSRLGDAIGLELETERTEAPVGPYSADILALDSTTGEYVVIENQLTKTNHDHLGKAITYASVLGARTVIWVAPDFTDEHHKALDWLNDNIPGELSFYGIQIELWSIDDSRPAIKFNVVSRPAEIVREALATKSAELSETRQIQHDWWVAYRKQLVASKVLGSTRTPRASSWYSNSLGRSGIHLSNCAIVNGGRIDVRIYLRGRSGGDSALEQLLVERETIEKEIGESLQWNPNPDAKDKTIGISRNADLRDRKRWPEYIDWMVDMTTRFHKVFRPRVKELELVRPSEIDDSEDDQ